MFEHFENKAMWVFVPLLVLLLSFSVTLAQDDVSRILAPDAPVNGALGEDTLAQVYTYDAVADETIGLTITSESGLALALVVTDAQGVAVAQAVDDTASGTISLDAVTLPQDGTYYFTVFAAPGLAVPAVGEFEITLEVVAPAASDVPQPSDVSQPGQILTTTGLQVSLSWTTTADMNLEVRDPVGGTLLWDSRTTDSGGSFGFDANGLCEVLTSAPLETASWPAGPIPTGSYEILVFYRQPCENTDPVPFTLNVVVDGIGLAPIQGTLLPPLQGQASVFLSSFTIQEDGTVVMGESGVYTDALAVSVQNLPAVTELVRGVPQQGVITNAQPYAGYTFPGQANEIISVNLNAVSGSLDTMLYLLGPAGNLVDSNDDAFNTTDSALNNLRLVASGEYTVIATRYGQNIGGTEGGFQIELSGPTSDLPDDVLALNLPGGDIEVSLLWNTGADLQLRVGDSAGDSVYDDQQTVPSGGRLAALGNINCTQSQVQPVSYIYWPTGFLRAGSYEVEVWYQDTCNDLSAVEFSLNVTVGGQLVSTERVRPLPGQRYVTNFRVEIDGTVIPGVGGIVGDSGTLNFQPEIIGAAPILSGQSVTGSIRADNTFDLYRFEGRAGDVVTIGMQASGGTLDPNLFLIGPGSLEVAADDDEIPGENTNALIDQVALQVDGEYIIIATRFATAYGGTEGAYNLSLRLE